MQEDRVKLTKYIWLFSAIYAGIFSLVNVLFHGFNIDVGSGANMVMLLGASYGSAIIFVKDNERAPSERESNTLSFLCLLITLVISALGTCIIAFSAMSKAEYQEFTEVLKSISPAIWVIVSIVVGVFYFLMLKLVFGWGANKYASKVVARKM